MLKRKALDAMKSWKANKTHQALLVTGGRQVGKTFLIRDFGRQNYGHFVEINLLENTAARTALALSLIHIFWPALASSARSASVAPSEPNAAAAESPAPARHAAIAREMPHFRRSIASSLLVLLLRTQPDREAGHLMGTA